MRDAPEEERWWRSVRLGSDGWRMGKELMARSSPKRAWPQKAHVAAAKQATSRGSARDRAPKSAAIIDDDTGGQGPSFAEGGRCASMPRTRRERRALLLNGELWNKCQARRPDRSLRTEELEREPRDEAANAQSTFSEAGKRSCRETSRELQNARSREIELL